VNSVIHSCTSSSFSGLEAYVLDLVTWQHQQGQPVELFCRAGSQLEAGALKAGVPVWSIGATASAGPRLWMKMRQGWSNRLQHNSGKLVLHMHAGGEPAYHLPWLHRVRAILHFHIWINHKKTDPLHRALYSGVKEIWTSSESARAHLATLLPVRPQQIRVVPYGRDVTSLKKISRAQARSEIRAKYNIAADDVLAICVSRFERIKGVRELFDAFVEVASQNSKAQLMIIGNESPNNAEAKAYADAIRAQHAALKPELKARLHLPGFVSPCEQAVAASDFYVLPTYEECMSLAMLDALILGLPILGTNSGGTPSVARPDETGALVPPANSKALARELGHFYRDTAKLKEMGLAAAALGATFDREDIFRQISIWYGV
jgi:D-inositol-3-phosphate glycosyltransferase